MTRAQWERFFWPKLTAGAAFAAFYRTLTDSDREFLSRCKIKVSCSRGPRPFER
jgi:hypothetical protein